MPTPIAGLRTAIAICNDLNPPVNLGEWCIENDVRLLVVICAWLSSEQSKALEGGTQTDVDELDEGAQQLEQQAEDESVDDMLEAREEVRSEQEKQSAAGG